MWLSFVGSNSHNNNSPAGDGQAGDAGEGKSGKWVFFLFLVLFFFNFYILYINSRKKLRKTLKVKDSNKTNVIQYPIFAAHSLDNIRGMKTHLNQA